ncbi:MAG: phosphoethanolamine transferase [Gammaproteobacteria bacterium]
MGWVHLVLPLVILAVSGFTNADKWADGLARFGGHTLLQGILIFALLAVLRGAVLLRGLWAACVALDFFLRITFGSSLTLAIVMSIFSSSPSEAAAFASEYGVQFTVGWAAFFALWFLPVFPGPRVRWMAVAAGSAYLFLPTLLGLSTVFSSPGYAYHLQTGVARGNAPWLSSLEYVIQNDMSWRLRTLAGMRGVTDSINLFLQSHDTASSWSGVSTPDDAPELLVIGLGESLRAGNLGVYGYDRNTTPRLEALGSELTVYTRAYAAGTNTWSSVPTSMTRVAGLPDLSKSLINLARDAGYETRWISNHARFSTWDFSVSTLAGQADEVFFTVDDGFDHPHDGVLVDQLESVLADWRPGRKLLIVIHFYGSHFKFNERYPAEFARFSGPDPLLDAYDNSVLFSDHLQARIIELLRPLGGRYLFFADHGLLDPHGPMPLRHDVRETPTLESLHVPLLVWGGEGLDLPADTLISLYYFECLFSRWSGIKARELEAGGYCDAAFQADQVSFLDSGMRVNWLSPQTPRGPETKSPVAAADHR